MKYMFVSDIHGNVENLEKCIKSFETEKADKLVILGDTASHTDEFANEEIVRLLSEISRKVEIIRGNCDTYDFEKMLDTINISMYDMDTLYINGKFVTITHGHYYNCYELPDNCGEIFIQGHTHVPMLQKQNDRILANPGSVSKPRGVDLSCYIIIDEEKITMKTLDGKLVKEIAHGDVR